MKFWILKTEPTTYSFDDLMRDKKTMWDGVRNYQARNNLKSMAAGDTVIIYESVGPKAAVGVAKIVKTAYQDPRTKEDWVAVDVAAVRKLARPVTLSRMKGDKTLKDISLVKSSRLSVCPITEGNFARILKLSETAP